MVTEQSTPLVDGVQCHRAGTQGYDRATTPLNAFVTQRPALVAVPTDADQVAACVRYAAEHGLTVVPQATGHGAAAELDQGVLLVDTSGLASIHIDADARSATVGAGCTWGAVDVAAAEHGLLGRAGSAPTVGVTGFTFGAGAGWLVRAGGLASGSLTAVDYVDGRGEIHRAGDDAERDVDRDVIWACRGGGGVGLAVVLEFGLLPVRDLWAGYLLWPIGALDAVVAAWIEGVRDDARGPATSLAVLQAPPSPAVPDELHGHQVVHLAIASPTGEDDASALRHALTRAPTPVIDTWGPSDVERLGGIHLDPPVAAPAVGYGRWLNDRAFAVAGDVLRAAVGQPMMMTEIRDVRSSAAPLEGAMDREPGGFMLHSVGGPDERGALDDLHRGLEAVAVAAAPADTGLAVASWNDSRTEVPDGLPPQVRARVAAIADTVDPDRVLARSTVLRPGRADPAKT